MNRTTRRGFVKVTAGAMLAGCVAPTFLYATDKAGAKHPVTGTGDQSYEVLHDWLTPPPHITWGSTRGVAQDSLGRIYVGHTVNPASRSPDAIVVFSDSGEFITSWGEQFRDSAHGLDIRREPDGEFIYHCDPERHHVVKTTLAGEVVWQKGYPEEAGVYQSDETFKPTNVAFAPNGDFYVTDGYGSDWIHQYDIAGRYIRSWGGKGEKPGKFQVAHGLRVDSRGDTPRLVVADRSNQRLQFFSLTGESLGVMTDKKWIDQPCDCQVHGDLMMVPDIAGFVTIFDRNDQLVVALCDGHPHNIGVDAPRDQFTPGQFARPHDAVFLKSGDILVVEAVDIGRVTRLRKLG